MSWINAYLTAPYLADVATTLSVIGVFLVFLQLRAQQRSNDFAAAIALFTTLDRAWKDLRAHDPESDECAFPVADVLNNMEMIAFFINQKSFSNRVKSKLSARLETFAIELDKRGFSKSAARLVNGRTKLIELQRLQPQLSEAAVDALENIFNHKPLSHAQT